MKTMNFNRLLFLILLSITILSCSKDDDNNSGGNSGATSKVSFIQENYTITPQMDSVIIPLKLEPKAFIDGFITIELSGNATYGSDYITIPEVSNGKVLIELLINTQSTNLIIYKTNENYSIEKTLNLKLSNSTTGFSIGSTNNTQVTFEAQINWANKLNFNTSIGQINENNNEGLSVMLNTTSSVPNGSVAKIKIISPAGINYGTHFYTIPEAVDNSIHLTFNQNAQSTSFKIIPINDNMILDNRNILFEIIETSETLEIGENNEFTATIIEDDFQPGATNTIAELKSNFSQNQNDWFVPTDYFIEGIITSDKNVIDEKAVYIQDNTSGIMIRFITANTYKLGDKVRVNIKNGTGRVVNGEYIMDYINISQVAKYAENLVVQPELITIEQLNTGNYQGKRVKLVGVYFESANGQQVFEGNQVIKQNNLGAIVTTYSTADFSNNVLPMGEVSVTGIVGKWNYIFPQKYSHDITN
ncbi:DUF5689 domain-containing protein [Mariniflexile soesokkakense]|uniref:DUF5689 domain-containing protein n=1 Tax=Mariniflexile soesokkakense TaxID=1343160 RepID=A0ABV0AFG3_9FLAO